MLWLLLLLAPGLFIVAHTLLGVLLMLPYGVESIRWNRWTIEVVAKANKDGHTRIWFRPSAQTWGLMIFYASAQLKSSEPLRVHERVHILQSLLFGAVYPVTYLFIFFPLLYVAVKLGAWKNSDDRDDIWRAYRRIPWEIWAYHTQHRFELRSK